MSDSRRLGTARLALVLLAATGLAGLAGCDAPGAKHRAAGNLYFKDGKYADAKKEYEAALEDEPKNAGSHILLGNADFELSDFAGARAEYEAALAIDGKSAEAHRGLAIVIARTSKPGDAASFDAFLAHIQAVIDANPNDRNAMVSAAQVLSENANPADPDAYLKAQVRADEYLKKARQIDDKDPRTLFQSALVWARKGDLPAALSAADRLDGVVPGKGYGPYTKAAIYAIAKDPDKAFAALGDLIATGKVDPASLRKDALLAPLAADPRFEAALAAAGPAKPGAGPIAP